MQRQQRVIAGMLALALVSSGCFGTFALTRKLYNWNATVSQDRWVREFVFIVLAWVPVYSLAGLGDAIVFNSIEFWTGENPIETPIKKKADAAQLRHIARHDAEAVLSLQGHEMTIEQFQHGRTAGSLHIAQQGDQSIATDAQGRVLFMAQTLPDGSVLIKDADGRLVKSYSLQERDEILASLSKQ